MQLFVPWYLLRYQLKAQRSLSFPLSAQSTFRGVFVCVTVFVCFSVCVPCHHHYKKINSPVATNWDLSAIVYFRRCRSFFILFVFVCFFFALLKITNCFNYFPGGVLEKQHLEIYKNRCLF